MCNFMSGNVKKGKQNEGHQESPLRGHLGDRRVWAMCGLGRGGGRALRSGTPRTRILPKNPGWFPRERQKGLEPEGAGARPRVRGRWLVGDGEGQEQWTAGRRGWGRGRKNDGK